MKEPLPTAPSALRNRTPIAAVLQETLPDRGIVLEVASGTGEHAEYFPGRFPGLVWQPSERDRSAISWLGQRQARAGLTNLRPPVSLDAESDAWPIDRSDAILCINMVHISPWTATQGLMRGAARILSCGAPLILYGPYIRADVPTAPSNIAFDQSLRSRDPAWGVRQLDEVQAEADRHGFRLDRIVDMPANNLTLIFRRR